MTRRRWTRWFWMPLALGGASGVGAAIGLIASREQGAAHLAEGWHQGKYTYGEGCGAGSEKDPINIVFVGDQGLSSYVKSHASAHGWWMDGGSQQYFSDHGECEPKDDESASGGVLESRYHMRYNEGDISGTRDRDPEWGYYTLAAAHHEDVDLFGGCLPPRHAVDGNFSEPPGGFNMGRDEVYNQWVNNASHGHVRLDVRVWDNSLPRLQCDGEYAWSDSNVYYISMPWPPSSGGNPCGRSSTWYNC